MAENKVQAGNSENLTNRGRGRPAGSVNKATKTFRDTVNALLEANSENVATWLQTVAEGIAPTLSADGETVLVKGVPPAPDKALDLLAKLAEYAAPKLSRTEMANADDKAFETVNRVQFEIVNPQA